MKKDVQKPEIDSVTVGRYSEVTLRDGGKGNYEVAQEYYQEFRRLSKSCRPDFNRLCSYILANPEAPLEREHKAILAQTKFAWQTEFLGEATLLKPEEEIKDFVCLSVHRGFLNRLLTAWGRATPQCQLISPFKTPCFHDDQVSVQYRKEVPYVKYWDTADIMKFSGVRLRIDN